jgi:tetratricopeptide (TPR) repeat protein
MPILKTARCAWVAAFAAALSCGAAVQADDAAELFAKGQQMRAEGHYAEAQTVFSALLGDAEKSGSHSRSAAIVLENLGVDEQDWGHYTQAETDFNQALAKFHGDSDDAVQLDLKTHLAELYIAEQRAEDADPLLRHVIATLESCPHPDHLALAVAYEDLAVTGIMRRKLSEPETLLRQAIALAEAEDGPNQVKLADCLFTYASLLTREHRYTDAVEPAERAWRILEDTNPAVTKPYRASALTVLSAVYLRAGRLADAESCAHQSIDLAESSLGPSHPRLVLYLDNYADILRHMDRKREAKDIQKKADAIRSQLPTPSGGYTVNIASLR